jgi:nitroimidazol reductase NimA-like FMN-containing flavoprotein (pyridoxamine 5'-phosphate oxidase superfamily)
MRRVTNEITDRATVLELLSACQVGRLGTVTADGYPMIKPLNFLFHDNAIYFHSAREGEKIDDIQRSGKVCFEVDEPLGYVRSGTNPCSATFQFRSVIIRGRASIVTDEAERLSAFSLLMEKYQPEGGYGDFLPDKLALTAVIRIDIEEMTGKQSPAPAP